MIDIDRTLAARRHG